MEYEENGKFDNSALSNDKASSKTNYEEKSSDLPSSAMIESESTGSDSITNRNQTVTITKGDNDVNMADFQSIHKDVSYHNDENSNSVWIENSENGELEQDLPNSFRSSKNGNLEYDMGLVIDCDQNQINPYYSFTVISNKHSYETLKEDLMQSKTILINIEEKYEKSPKEIAEIYRNFKYHQFSWFLRRPIQKKIKTYSLKFIYNKLLSLLCEQCHHKFPKFTKNFVEIIDIESEKKLFSYPNMKVIMKLKDFVTGESIEIFIKKKTNFKDNESYLEFIRIISLDYAGWIKAYLSYCSENYDLAEKKIKINQTNSQKNIDGERKATIMSDYFKLFWKEAEGYINYFRNKSPNSKPVGGRKQAIKAKKI